MVYESLSNILEIIEDIDERTRTIDGDTVLGVEDVVIASDVQRIKRLAKAALNRLDALASLTLTNNNAQVRALNHLIIGR